MTLQRLSYGLMEWLDFESAVVATVFRDFIENSYVGLKQNNPTFPILIRECSGVKPKLWARYGKTVCICLITLERLVVQMGQALSS